MAQGFRSISMDEAQALPRWRRPEALLYVMAAAMPIAFSTWQALLNNFVIEAANFTGVQIGWLQSVREVPGFLAIGVILVLMVMREQMLALMSLVLLGAAVAATALFPSFGGLLATTILSSIGFHYFQTVNQSLQLQWIDRERAPRTLGRIVALGSAASLGAYLVLVLTWRRFDLSFETVYAVAGAATAVAAVVCFLLYPQFRSRTPQQARFVLRRRYWLYYALQLASGARRQIFVVFAAFMMVQRFGFHVDQITVLFIINYAANMVLAPVVGRLLGRFGERSLLTFEYAGLLAIFLAYAGIYHFGWGGWVAAGLYVVDQIFFALAFAMTTYFQKICDPEDIAPTAAVSFTINHIAAVFLPVALGYVWIQSPGAVFGLAAGIATVSLGLALLIPRHPAKGNETLFSRLLPAQPAE
ncbi:MFS transporter [Acidimangrovimonas sediminis]|uniref:MFS transporter n=1 Tax=Acidimangrovimonas sediminis TaxID=2056283 RepID=UPI001E3E56B6|nr:MFS transporter [Acidimangrovimonas sediminis]